MQQSKALSLAQGLAYYAIRHVVEDKGKGSGSSLMQVVLADCLEPLDELHVTHPDPSVALLHLNRVHISSV